MGFSIVNEDDSKKFQEVRFLMPIFQEKYPEFFSNPTWEICTEKYAISDGIYWGVNFRRTVDNKLDYQSLKVTQSEIDHYYRLLKLKEICS